MHGNLKEFQAAIAELDGLPQQSSVEATCVIEKDGKRKWLWTVILKNLTAVQISRLRET